MLNLPFPKGTSSRFTIQRDLGAQRKHGRSISPTPRRHWENKALKAGGGAALGWTGRGHCSLPCPAAWSTCTALVELTGSGPWSPRV